MQLFVSHRAFLQDFVQVCVGVFLDKYCDGQDVKSSGPSSIKDHISKTGHKATFEDFSILAKTDNSFDLLIYESL